MPSEHPTKAAWLIASLLLLATLAALGLADRSAATATGAGPSASPAPPPGGAPEENARVGGGRGELARSALTQPDHVLVGSVVDAVSGQPVYCFTLACRAEGGDPVEPCLVQEAEGRFRVRGLRSGRYTVTVADGVSRQTVLTGVRIPRAEELSVRLDRGAAIAGCVVDGHGRAVADVEVVAVATGDRGRVIRCRTGRDGRFSASAIEPGDYEVHVDSWERWPEHVRVPPGGTGSVELRLAAAAALRAGATGARGAPLAGVQFLLWSRDGACRPAESAPDGTVTFLGLPCGSYTLHVSHPDHRAEQRTIELVGATDQAVQLALVPRRSR